MMYEFQFSDTLFREYLNNKITANRIALVVSVILYIVIVQLNKRGHGILQFKNESATFIAALAVTVVFAFGIAGVCASYSERHAAKHCGLGMEDNIITYMCNTKERFLADGSMRGWQMKEVQSVEEHKTYYLVKAKGVYVPDTRFMDRQRPVTSLKIPKWFVGMERLKQAEVK